MFRQARRRIGLLRGLFLAGSLLLAGRLAQLQFLEHGYWSYQGFLNREKVLPRPVRRGSILDRAGRPLAQDEGAHDVEVIFQDFRRGNPLGQAFHLKLLVLPPPILDPQDWRATKELFDLIDRKSRLDERIDREGDATRRESLVAERTRLERAIELGRRPRVPDPRPVTLFWAREHLGELARFVHEFGSADLPDPDSVPPPHGPEGPSWEDLRQAAGYSMNQARWYLLRLISGALECRGSRDPAGRETLAEWRRQGGGSLERWLRRRWRDEIDRPGARVPSFAAFFGVGAQDLEAHLRQGLDALCFPGAPGKDALARFDEIHLRNVRLLAYPFLNEWPLWDRSFRNTLRFHEDRREPLWRNVPFEVVREIALGPRAHQGFVVIDSVRRAHPAEEGRSWTPAARLLGRVTGAFQEDLERISLATDTEWLESPLPGLEDYWIGYRRDVERRAVFQKVGFVRFGKGGLEGLLEESLAGEEGWRMVQTDRLARLRLGELEWRKPETPGRDVRVTLDLDLQTALESALARIDRGDRTNQAGAAVVDCRTGDVLALASTPLVRHSDLALPKHALAAAYPGCDPAEDWSRLWPRASPPGSTFKVVTAAAALRAGLAGTESCQGFLPLPWGRIHCEGVHGLLGLEEALERSCNVYFGALGLRLGSAALAQEAERFGFGRGWTWLGPALYRNPPKLETSEGNAARQAIGYRMGATPLAMARVYATVASGMIRPLRIVEQEPPGPGQSLGLAPGDLARIREGLRRVVGERGGTARRFGLDELGAAGKTGTAQLSDGGEGENNAWFAGFAPRSTPLLAFAILAPGVPHGRHGGAVSAPVAREFLADPVVRAWIEREGGGR